MTVSGALSRPGHSSVRYSALATATGTPSSSAMVEVISVPTTSGSAPKIALETSQSLEKTKPKTPWCDSAGRASTNSRMKKNARRTKMPTARVVSPSRRILSGRRADDGRSSERPPVGEMRVPASMLLRRGALDRLPVALQGADLGLGHGEHGGRQRRVLEVGRDLLAVARRVLQPRLDLLGLRLADAGLAEILVDEQERDRRDRVGLGSRRVDRREPQVRGRLGAFAGRRGRVERRGDELAVLVLHVRGREVVLQRVGLLDVADRALRLLDAARDAVIALRARARRPF